MKIKLSDPLVLTVIAAVMIVTVGIWRISDQGDADFLVDIDSQPERLRDRRITIGGIERPLSDVEPRLRGDYNGTAPEPPKAKEISASLGLGDWEEADRRSPFGVFPLLKRDDNEMVRDVYAQMESEEPSVKTAVNPFAKIEAFDRQEYLADPEAYLNQVVPARIWQAAQPGEGVVRLRRVGRRNQRMLQGESLAIQVKGEPEMPVTFQTLDAGAFENRLTTITVAADEQGIATARYTATRGTINQVKVLASSPVASGLVEMNVSIALPSSQPQRNLRSIEIPTSAAQVSGQGRGDTSLGGV